MSKGNFLNLKFFGKLRTLSGFFPETPSFIVNTFSADAQKQVEEAIKAAELETSGEVRVHIDARCKGNVLDRAAHIFEKLQMHKTELRNGVLFYLALKDKKFAILGDAGINAKVPEDFWEEVKLHVLPFFRRNAFAQGLSEGIIMAGNKLKEHFPYMEGEDINELPDEISFGDQ